jgi:hypothetical protein
MTPQSGEITAQQALAALTRMGVFPILVVTGEMSIEHVMPKAQVPEEAMSLVLQHGPEIYKILFAAEHDHRTPPHRQ